MSGLHDASLGKNAVLKSGARGLLRRARHGDASLAVDASDEVGLVLNLSEAHRVEGTMAGLAVGTLRPRLNEHDPKLARLLYAVAIAGDDADEAVAGVASYLVASHAEPQVGAPAMRSGGIAPARLAGVLDRMDADADGSTSLEALGGEAGMSTFHFARKFARTVGLPPHGHLIQRRVDRAILLLSFPTLTIADVARRAGLSHSSHLARHMRRLTGASPEVMRRASYTDCRRNVLARADPRQQSVNGRIVLPQTSKGSVMPMLDASGREIANSSLETAP